MAESVPLLEGTAGDDSRFGVVGIEVRRVGSETIPAAVAIAAGTLSNAVPSLLAGQLILVGASQPLAPFNRLGALTMKRESLWNRWENNGAVLPSGDRQDFQLDRTDELLQFGGWLVTDAADFGAAIEITRERPAVLLLVPSGFVLGDLVSSIEDVRQVSVDGNSLVSHFVPLLPEDGTLIRGFGSFDDRVVGIDVYADDQVLDGIQSGVERWLSSDGIES
ncbi:hypothetical protein ACWFRB_02790 [Rhodococcus sp. NPDC055112]